MVEGWPSGVRVGRHQDQKPIKTAEQRREELAARQPTVVVDWDGVCVEDKWPEMGEWLPGAKEGLRALLDAGYKVRIHTCRLHNKDLDEETLVSPEQRRAEWERVRSMLGEADLWEVDIVNEDKPPATYYVDDKAIRFEGDWQKVLDQVIKKEYADPLRIAERQPFPRYEFAPGTSELIRQFESGATRNSDHDKLNYRACLSPLVLKRYAEYIASHREQPDGTVRSDDNWKNGMPLESYLESGFRHFMDWYSEHEGYDSREGVQEALCGLMFNCMGYLHSLLVSEAQEGLQSDSRTQEEEK